MGDRINANTILHSSAIYIENMPLPDHFVKSC